MVDGDFQALVDVRLALGAVQLKLRAPADDVLLMADIVVQDLLEIEHLRLALDKREHIDRAGVLKLGVFVQQIEHDLRVGVLLDLDDDAHARAARLVADVADAVDALGLDEVDHIFQQQRAVDLIGQLSDDDARPPALFLEMRFRAHADAAAAGHIRLADTGGAVDGAVGRKIRPLDVLHQLGDRAVGVVDHIHRRVDDLAEIVGRDVRRHADGDAGGAVHKELRNAAPGTARAARAAPCGCCRSSSRTR